MNELLIIDGYNLLHLRHPGGFQNRAIMEREKVNLTQEIRGLQGTLARQTAVVFDGAGESTSHEEETGAFSVIYSKRNQSADALIERMAERHPDPASVMVVSSDRAIATLAQATGCQVQSARQFLEHCLNSRRDVEQVVKRSQSGRPPSLGDFFPE